MPVFRGASQLVLKAYLGDVPVSKFYVGDKQVTFSGGSVVPAPVNTVLPAITGTLQVGQTLNISNGTWTGTGITYTYQWLRNGTPITGSINSTRILTASDLNAKMSCIVTATNATGSVNAKSADTVAVADAPAALPVNKTAPIISGTPNVGQTLTVSDPGTWDNLPNGYTGYTYQWRRNGANIDGATASSYQLLSADLEQNIVCRVTATNSGGSTPAVSNTLKVVTAVDTNRYFFAGTRLRYPSVTGNMPATNFQLQSFYYGSPSYPTNSIRFFIPTFYQLTTGATTSEIAGPNTINLEGISVKVNGTWYVVPNSAFTVDPSVESSGYLLEALTGVTIPADSMIECRVAFNAPQNAVIWGVVRGSDYLGEKAMGASTSLAAGLTDGRTITGGTAVSRQFIPSYVVAKGWDGREVACLVGDSIQAGDRENSLFGFQNARGCVGYWQRGLDDNINSKRIPFGTLSLEGARPTDWATRANWARKLDGVKKVTDLNGGKPPFTFVGSNHGTNSSTTANPYSWLTAFWQRCKDEWPGIPIHHSEMLQRPGSTDGYQTLANQTTSAPDSYNGGSSPGIRWAANEIIGKGALTGDPSSVARSEGWIASSFAPWRILAYDTGNNRDKLAIAPCNTTLAQDVAAGTPTIILTDKGGLQIGDVLIVNPGGSGTYDVLVKDISGNTITLMGNTPQAFTAGTNIVAAYHDRTGLHPSTVAHKRIAEGAVIPWKVSLGWVNGGTQPVVDPAPLSMANLPSAMRTALPGSNIYEGGAYANGRLVGRFSTNALKDAATAALPTGWTRDNSNKTIILTSNIPSDQTTISDWLFENDWSIRIPASGGSALNFSITNNVFKPTKTKSYLIDNRQNGSLTIQNNNVGGAISDADQSPMTFLMHPGGLGRHIYKDNAFWNMPEDHIRLSEGGGLIDGNFFFGGGLNNLVDPHFDCIQVLPNVVPRTLKGDIIVRNNSFDMRRGVGHTQAIRLADIEAIDAGVKIEIYDNVTVDPNFDISFPKANWPTLVTNNYIASQPFPANQKDGAADYGDFLTPIPSQAIIHTNYRLETGAKLAFEQNKPA